MPFPQERTYTIEDIYALPNGQRAELIAGQIYLMAPPARIHQKLVSELTQILGQHIKSKNGSCEIYPAHFAVFLNADNNTYVEPDLSIICDKHKLNDQGCMGAPDFVIEIVSLQPQDGLCYQKHLILKCWCAGILDCRSSQRTHHRILL